jgi:hypothetical protein
MQRVLLREVGAIIVLIEIRAFTTGCVLELDFVARPEGPVEDRPSVRFTRAAAGGGPRIGVRFADGRKAINGEHVLEPESAPEPPILRGFVGAGFHRRDTYVRLREQLWLWPLPPAEDFELVVAWPGMGIQEVHSVLDGAAIVAASAESQPYWAAGSAPR